MSEKIIVTGAAGFIGSHLCESLVGSGRRVIGVDSFNPYYDKRIKRSNVSGIIGKENFELIEQSLNDVDLDNLVSGADYVFHMAAQPGVRASWAARFDEYIDSNIRATQRLCEACKGKPIKRFIYASSSSVYGETAELPMGESHVTRPHSPYGVTKLSGEALCLLYRKNFGLPVVSLRFFTVFGPRQRPDMAFHKFIASALEGKPVEVYGNGSQTRDFTYVGDIVNANLRAMEYDGGENVFNVGGGNRVTLNVALDVLTECLPKTGEMNVVYKEPIKGDVSHTYADISLAERELGYSPKTSLEEGMKREIEWIVSLNKMLRSS